ncbi:hypothetical protein SLEP1_g56882 [Rubroshorea leprosula]|uniref:Uncharacterized protein n=1 Tax=Rubroshorea leprosula TaxID=152421 RepID=A0AAV5MMC8_9ROSI|nr:hypothetical protein SLEP1_g56882 [Rubroshorea leprosula]
MESTRGTARGAATGNDGEYRQRQGHRNRAASFGSQFSGWLTTFFFYNFTEELEAKFLWNCFQMYGKVVDVYVPSKRDKRGKRFGFVQMAGVKNELQMERQLNTMWIGSYKMKVKIAEDRQRKPAQSRKLQGAVKEYGSTSKMNRLVQPGQSYAQVVKGKGKKVEKAQIQPQDKDEDKDEVNKRAEENMVVEYTPTGEELQWLEGGMVAVVRSLGLISEIQEHIGIDGGSISLTPIGGRRVLLTERAVGYLSEYKKINEELFDLWFESIKSWETTPEETSRMVWLRILVVPLKAWESRRIAKRIKLKVGDQLYEIEIAEEEWRSDPDWWLTENDQNNVQIMESDDFSVAWSQNEDSEMGVDVICDGDDVRSDSEHLMKDLDLNSNSVIATGKERWKQSETEREFEGDERYGQVKEHGLQSLKSMEEIWAKRTPLVTPRTSQRRTRRLGDRKAREDKERLEGSMSISDGDIVNRNRVLQREMNLYEVCRMMRVGKRLGIQFEDDDEELQYRLIEAEDQERAGMRDGLGRKEVGKLVREERPDFLFLQETKLERIDVGICKLLWNSDEFEWVAKASSGASGGLLCLWDRRHFVKREEFTGDGYVGISGEWGVNKQECSLINVYGPNDRQKRAKMWEELRKRVIDKEGRWLIAGDFNAVRGPEEKRGKTGVSSDMRDFEEFIVTTGIVDVKLTNRHYTWYKPDGTARSRLDRFWLSTEMNNMGGEWIQQGLPRNISDHCAMVLKSKSTDWGPRPFRVLDAWQQHPEFKKAVEDKWREMAVEGFAGYKCKQKLKMLKEFLKGWNKEVFGNMEAQYVQAVKKIEQFDMQNEVADLEELEIVKRQEGFSEIWDVLRKRELIWKQKSRSRWIQEGDANTRFFHKVANGRRAQNNIAGLMSDGEWIEDPEAVKNEMFKYFRSVFQGDPWNRPKPSGIKFQKISEEKKEWLERPFSVEEIEEGLRSCDGSKALGPNGVLALNEVVYEIKNKKQPAFVFKADFEKAYDCVDWSFLYWMMDSFGFGIKWRGWIMECLSTARTSILVNGSPTREFEVGKGLRQGDPLSPFLFLMIGEGLQDLVQKAMAEGMVHGIVIGKKGMTVSLLQFVDDTIIMGRADAENIRMVKDVLRWFELMFGLRINFKKSSIYGYNVSEGWLKGSAGMLRCGVGLNKKISWMKWEYVCRDKMKGGLGVPDLLRKNRALLGKWWYRLGDGVENLWKRVVREKYYGGRSEVDITAVEGSRVSKLWRDIIRMGGQSSRLRNMLVEGFKWEVEEGNKEDFWQERWVGDKTLRDLCPRLYALSVKKEGKVSEMGSWNEGRWCWHVVWRRGTIGREKDEEVVLEKTLEGVQVKEGIGDVWKWRHVMDGRYVVKIAYDYLDCMEGVLED